MSVKEEIEKYLSDAENPNLERAFSPLSVRFARLGKLFIDLKDADLTHDNNLEDTLNLIIEMVMGAETDMDLDEQEGSHLAWDALETWKLKLKEGEQRKEKIEEVEPLDRILESAASLKVKMEREGASYMESELSEIISTLLIEFEGSVVETGEREAFNRLKDVWDTPFDEIEPDGWVESHLPPLAKAEFKKKYGKGRD